MIVTYRAERQIGHKIENIGPERETREEATKDVNQYVDSFKPATTTSRQDDNSWITFVYNVTIIHVFVTTIIN